MRRVTVFSSDSCGYCKRAKDFLDSNGVGYSVRNVDSDESARAEMVRMGAKGVPVIVVDDEIIMGFNEKRLDELFGKRIVECPSCRQKLRFPRNIGTIEATCPKCSKKFRFDTGK